MSKCELSVEESQQITIEILKKVSDICEKLSLKYFLAYGTLLGAVRHNGFIPWDDDIDIMMPRNDYDELLKYFINHESELYPLKLFTTSVNPDYPYMIARISDCNYILDVENEKNYGIGLFIDIYPLDWMGNDYKKAVRTKKKVNAYISLCFLSTRLKCVKGNTKSKFKLLIKFPAFCYAHLKGKNYFMNKINRIAEKNKYSESEYIGCLVWCSDGALKEIRRKELYEETIDIKFDNYYFKIPKKYDEILKIKYGDYMEYPPEDERIAHHFYKVFKK